VVKKMGFLRVSWWKRGRKRWCGGVVVVGNGGGDGGENGGGIGGGDGGGNGGDGLPNEGHVGFVGCCFWWLCLLEKEEGRKIMIEREGSGGIYIRVKFIITILPSTQSKRNARMETCVSKQLKPASGLLELDAEIVAASKKENTKSR